MTSRLTQTMRLVLAVAFGATFAARSVDAQQAGPTPQERVAALKQSMQESQTKIRQYEWTETTIISLKGEEKNRTQKRCYYGADGKLQKTPVGGPPAAQPPPDSGGRRGRVKARVVENKKDDMKDYMERATALVQQYVPPQPSDLQRAKDAGKVTAKPAGPGLVRLEFPDYLKPGDRLSIDVDAAANQLRGLTVASYWIRPTMRSRSRCSSAHGRRHQLYGTNDARCRREEDPRRHPEHGPPSTRPVMLTARDRIKARAPNHRERPAVRETCAGSSWPR